MKIPFKTAFTDGIENVMVVSEKVNEIRFNQVTKEISIVCDDAEDFEAMSWQSVKELVEKKGGKWTNKKEGIEYLAGL